MRSLLGSREHWFPALSAGIAAGFLFFISASTDAGGVFLVFFPVFPLMLVGLALGRRYTARACITACLTTALLCDLTGMVFFAGFIALPVYYFISHCLMWRGNEENHEWYPVLRILSEITIAVALIFMLLALTTQELGGLKSLVPHDLGNNFKTTDPEFNAMEQQMLSDWSFVLFAIMGWLWVSLMYGFAVLANKLLATQSQTLRPSLAIEPRDIPAWLLLLVIVSGGLAMLGQGIDRFTAETLFLILLMPYLLCGLAFIHTWSRQRHFAFRRLWLTCFYIVLICTRWPVLAVIAIGLYLQLAEILDRRQTPEKYHK